MHTVIRDHKNRYCKRLSLNSFRQSIFTFSPYDFKVPMTLFSYILGYVTFVLRLA